MKAWKVLPVFSLALLWSVTAFAQDPTKVAAANYKVILENPSVRILKITYAPGAKSAPHSHPEAVVIPLVTSKVQFTGTDGKSEERELASEAAMFVPAETHSVVNLGTGPIDAILVEFKSKAPGTATLPDTRTNLGMKHIADSPRAVVYRAIGRTERSMSRLVRSTSSTRSSSPSAPRRCPWRSTANRPRPSGRAVTCSSSRAVWRTNRRIWAPRATDFVVVAIK